MKLFIKIAAIFGILVILLSSYFIFVFSQPIKVKEVVFEIRKGEPARSIARKLYDKKIIRSKSVFYLYIKGKKYENKLSYGKYLFSGKLSMTDIIEKVNLGKVMLRKITVPEGLTVKRTSRLLARNDFGEYEKYLSICNDSTFAKKLTGFSIPSLEGFLYPETYYFPEDVSEEFVISHLVKEFFNQTSNIDFIPNKKLDFYDIITLASIVEREARIEDEKPTIASVYVNRINYNYKLQADPTIAYFLEQSGKTRKKIYYRDLRIDSPYNTYKYYGLPPTPICNPSVSSIEAVLHPEETDYFFFFANGTGRHEFTRTYDQHINKQNLMKNGNGK